MLTERLARLAKTLRSKVLRLWQLAKTRLSNFALRFKENPYAVLLLFPFVATPATFATTQRSGVKASIAVSGAILLAATGAWSKAVTETSSLAMRIFDQAQAGRLNEASRQQLGWMLDRVLDYPLTAGILLFLTTLSLAKNGWHKGFTAIFPAGKEARVAVGPHYFLVQTTSNSLYVGLLMYGASTIINNWIWVAPYVQATASPPVVLALGFIMYVCSTRLIQHRSRVGLQLYGSRWGDMLSTLASFALTLALAYCLLSAG